METSFRTRVPRPSPVDAIRAALAGFAHKISTKCAVDIRQFDHWIEKVVSTVKSRVRRSDTHGRSFGNGARKYLRFLHSKLVIVPVDKAFNNAMFVCKHLICPCLE